MKVTVIKHGVVERKTYPYIGENQAGICVAFTAPRVGVVLANNDSQVEDFPLFSYHDDFLEEAFHPSDSEIVIRN